MLLQLLNTNMQMRMQFTKHINIPITWTKELMKGLILLVDGRVDRGTDIGRGGVDERGVFGRSNVGR
jgi:hypothetical protein